MKKLALVFLASVGIGNAMGDQLSVALQNVLGHAAPYQQLDINNFAEKVRGYYEGEGWDIEDKSAVIFKNLLRNSYLSAIAQYATEEEEMMLLSEKFEKDNGLSNGNKKEIEEIFKKMRDEESQKFFSHRQGNPSNAFFFEKRYRFDEQQSNCLGKKLPGGGENYTNRQLQNGIGKYASKSKLYVHNDLRVKINQEEHRKEIAAKLCEAGIASHESGFSYVLYYAPNKEYGLEYFN